MKVANKQVGFSTTFVVVDNAHSSGWNEQFALKLVLLGEFGESDMDHSFRREV